MTLQQLANQTVSMQQQQLSGMNWSMVVRYWQRQKGKNNFNPIWICCCLMLLNGLIILPYDQAAAHWYVIERARLQRQGLTFAYADGEIAAIAVTQKLTLVTRNTQNFQNFQNLVLQNWFV